MKKPRNTFCGQVHRREFLHNLGGGFASLGLAGMLAQDGFFQSKAMAKEMAGFVNPLAPKDPHYKATAKSVIFLFMYGGPSQVDTFDYKPKLYPLDGKTKRGETAPDIFQELAAMHLAAERVFWFFHDDFLKAFDVQSR